MDLDVHQGDGTAFMFREDPSVFTLSVHNEKNFPLIKQQSDLDVSLEDKVEDAEYLKTIVDVLPSVIDMFRPDLVLYDAGVIRSFHMHAVCSSVCSLSFKPKGCPSCVTVPAQNYKTGLVSFSF